MENTSNYISIMIDSLQSKIEILDSIIERNEEQKKILSEEELDMDKFYKNIDDKSALVEKLDSLDDGFTSLYSRVKEILDKDKSSYSVQITIMKDLISKITERSVKIQTDESRNKNLAERHFSRLKKEVGQAKRSGTMASNYYKAMSRIDDTPQFLDEKN